MFKQAFIICLVALSVLSAQATDKEFNYTHQTYQWEEKPVLHELSEEEKEASAVVIKDKRILEYVYHETGSLLLYNTIHKIIHVNDDQGVEAFNKVFVSMNDVIDFAELKARSVTPDGKVVELNRDNIEELENVQNYGNFKIFALEGVEKGGEVEYFYTTQSLVTEPYGHEFFQTEIKTKEASIEIISPDNLMFESRSYNGFPELERTEADSLLILKGQLDNISPLLEEAYSSQVANLAKVTYKLSYNTSRERKRLYTWGQAAELYYQSIYGYSKETEKEIQKILKKMKIKKAKADEAIRKIEGYLKTDFAFKTGFGPEYMTVKDILQNKYANKVGFIRLFAAFLKEANIEHELVLTSDRFTSKFDKEFADWNNFREKLFFFPQSGKYISPDLPYFRYGFPPYNMAGNNGLFIKAAEDWRVALIELPKAENSTNSIQANISFNEDFEVNMQTKHSWTGYRATEYRALKEYQGEDILRQQITSGIEGAGFDEIAFTNDKIQDSSYEDKILSVESAIKANSLIEKAGKSYLFKIGEVIGAQVELYQEQERQNPIDMQYPTYYKRTISFNIPEGYTLQGIEEVKIDKKVEEEGEIVNRFISDYTIEGSKVTVTADEYYQQVSLPKEKYEDFRGVINGAADFNKVVLIFEKSN